LNGIKTIFLKVLKAGRDAGEGFRASGHVNDHACSSGRSTLTPDLFCQLFNRN
jgi:hypothetical protein